MTRRCTPTPVSLSRNRRVIAASGTETSGWPSQSVRPRWHGKGVSPVLPRIILDSSPLHGLGLFADHDMEKGCFVTEYGGEYITRKDGMRMIKEGTDTHLLSIARAQFMVIDGRLQGQFNLDWYCSHHKVGAMANASTDAKIRNAKYVYLTLPDNQAYFQPYDWERSSKSHAHTSFLTRAFIVTTRAVKRGEEIIVDYGESYYDRHGFYDLTP